MSCLPSIQIAAFQKRNPLIFDVVTFFNPMIKYLVRYLPNESQIFKTLFFYVAEVLTAFIILIS